MPGGGQPVRHGRIGRACAGWTMVASYGCNFALSALFVISGYLLFRCYELSVWPRKIVRRVRRLMVPYVCWNVVFVLFYLSVARFFPRVGERVAAFGLDTWRGVLAKIAHPVAVPIDVPVWYLRAVFVFALLSPALWALLRHRVGRWIGLTAVAGWYLLDGVWGVVPGVPGYPTDALLAFSAGGLLAAGGTSPGTFFKSRWWLVPAVAALALDGWDAACGEGACPVALRLADASGGTRKRPQERRKRPSSLREGTVPVGLVVSGRGHVLPHADATEEPRISPEALHALREVECETRPQEGAGETVSAPRPCRARLTARGIFSNSLSRTATDSAI